MTFEELTATQGTPANDLVAREAKIAPVFTPPTAEPVVTPAEVADPPE